MRVPRPSFPARPAKEDEKKPDTELCGFQSLTFNPEATFRVSVNHLIAVCSSPIASMRPILRASSQRKIPARLDVVHRGCRSLAALGDQAQEPALRILHEFLGQLPRGLVRRGERRGHSLQGAASNFIHLHADLVEQVRNVRPLEDHTDRPRNGVAACDDVVSSDPAKIGRRRGNGSENSRNRLRFGKLPKVFVKRLASRRRSARAVDRDNNGFHVVVLGKLCQQFMALSAIANEAADGNARDLVAADLEKEMQRCRFSGRQKRSRPQPQELLARAKT